MARTCARRSARSRQGSVFVWLGVLTLPLGCALPYRQEAFFGRQTVPPPGADPMTMAASARGSAHVPDADQGGDAILAHGWAVSELSGQRIELRLFNHSARPLRLSAVVDDYRASTEQGHVVILEKDFLTYPDTLDPGQEKSVSLLLPKDLNVRDVKQLTATLNEGRTVIVVRAITPQETTDPSKEEPRIGEIVQVPDPILVTPSAPLPARPVPVVRRPGDDGSMSGSIRGDRTDGRRAPSRSGRRVDREESWGFE